MWLQGATFVPKAQSTRCFSSIILMVKVPALAPRGFGTKELAAEEAPCLKHTRLLHKILPIPSFFKLIWSCHTRTRGQSRTKHFAAGGSGGSELLWVLEELTGAVENIYKGFQSSYGGFLTQTFQLLLLKHSDIARGRGFWCFR